MKAVVAVVNQKGGVGKTTTTVNLATALAATKKRVLVVDLDPQGNASTSVGIDNDKRSITIYDVLIRGESCNRAIMATEIPYLDVITANIHLSAAQSELASVIEKEAKLRSALASVADSYDIIFIDCPPALGLLTVNALVAASHVLIPLQCEFLAMEGLAYLLNTVSRIRMSMNQDIQIAGIVLTMHDRRNRLALNVVEEVRREMGGLVYNAAIPRNVRLAEAPSHGKPAIIYDTNCSGSLSYMMLAKEFWEKL